MTARHLRYAVETGERVFLRYPVKSDRDEFVALRAASREHLEKWEPIPPSGLDTFSDAAFDLEYKTRKSPAQHRWLICTLDSGAIAGRITLGSIERGPFQNGRLGYWLGKDFTGKGYMQEALRLALTHCFGPLGLHRVCANVMPSNEPSKNALLRCGFVLEGYSSAYLQIQGAWKDHERYAITVERWNQLSSEAQPR